MSLPPPPPNLSQPVNNFSQNLNTQASQDIAREESIVSLSATHISEINIKLARIEEKLDQSWFDKILSLAKSPDRWQNIIFVFLVLIFVFLVVFITIAFIWALQTIPVDVVKRILGIVGKNPN